MKVEVIWRGGDLHHSFPILPNNFVEGREESSEKSQYKSAIKFRSTGIGSGRWRFRLVSFDRM